VLSINVFEGLVIRMEDKGLGFEVMTPIRQGQDYGIELLVIISAIIHLEPLSFSLK